MSLSCAHLCQLTMVSLIKSKKPYLPIQNGSPAPSSSGMTQVENQTGNERRKKKKKKKKKGNQSFEESLASTSSTAPVGNGDVAVKKAKTFVIGKKKIICDKLLLNMLKKKKKKQLAAALKAKAAVEASKNQGQGTEVVEQIPFSNKRKLSNSASTKSEDKIPLLQDTEEEDYGEPERERKVIKYKNNQVKADSPGVTTPDLPVTECREALIQRFKESDTLIVVGETGSGKSTQIPQFLLQDCSKLFSYRGIAITQPRRVAAISLANRVAYELGSEVGETVGFKVRFDKQVSEKTKITFLTDGYLMMDAIRNKTFDEYSVIIVDEAHERSVETDVVLSLLRNAQTIRKVRNPKKQLKLIIMSATLDVDKFKSFFSLKDHGLTTKAVYVKGRPFSLQLNYLPKTVSESHIDNTWITLLKLHMELPTDHHILVFLTGKEEIDLIVARANAINQRKDLARVFVCPLYAALSKESQMKSFELPPDNTRKIVVSTNLAETSLTIPGIRVVIDSGRVKSKYFEESLGMNVLRVQLISKSQSDQRAGRAGREFEGAVYRLYTKSDYEKMEGFPAPEITRSNLSRVLLLAAVSLGVNDFNEFQLPDRPSTKAIRYALNELHRFGAIEANQQPVKLTRTARRLLSFPVELHLARVLYLAVQYQELSRICAIIAMSTVETVYSPDIHEKETRHVKYRALWAPEGDFLTFWRIFKEYKKSKNKKAWCKEYSIQFKTMAYVTQVWRHLLTVCQSMELEEDERLSCGDAVDFKEKLLLIFKTAFSHQIARLSKTGGIYIVENVFDSSIKFHAKIHPTSSLIATKPGRLIFTHLSFNEVDDAVYMHNCGAL